MYPAYLYDTGVAAKAPIPGMLAIGPGIFGPPTMATVIDVDQMAKAAEQPLVDALSTNLNTFAGHGGKQIFYHGDSDPWFSALDTLGYYQARPPTTEVLKGIRMEPILFRTGNEPLRRRRGRAGQFRYARCHRELGGKGHHAAVG